MKLTILLLLAFSFQLSANIHAQERVSLALKNASLGTVLKAISKQTSYQYILPEQFSQVANPVDINVTNASLDDALAICFSNQPFTFAIIKKIIVVKEKEKVRQVAEVSPQAKNINAKGIVYNEAGQPLSGANVTIKETGKGVITNATGEYEFTGIPSTSTLVISFIGYAPQTIKVSDDKVMQVYLKVAKNELDKVVIQAYGTTTQRLNTGNIATVTAAEIERQPVMNPLTALEGKVPGLVITQTNGYASAPFKVEIRGRAQIDPNRSSEPLYIIDGVPLTVLETNGLGSYAGGSVGITQNGMVGPAGGQSPLFSINPNDIESISVLKDADATAIYGSRGANGVIIITTKSGKAGKTKFDINAYQGFSKVTQHYSMLNTTQYLTMRREAFINDGLSPDPSFDYDVTVWDTTKYTDWQSFLWGRVGQTTDVETSLTGGEKQTTFRIAGAYHRETDITTASGASQRISVQSNMSHKSLDQKLNVSLTTSYSNGLLNIIGLPGSVTLPPNAPSAFKENGQINWTGWYPSFNPFGQILQPYTSTTSFLNTRLFVQYELTRGLVLSTKLGYSATHNSQSSKYPIISLDPINNPTGSSQFGNNNNSNEIIEPQLEYKRTIAKGTIDGLIGGTFQSVTQDGNTISGSGYINDNLLGSISNAPSRTATDNNSQYKYTAIFGRLNYNWANEYIINLTIRRDGSSKFGANKQFGNFGAIGAAWVFSEESWIKKSLSFLSFGKIRGSYGITGSDNIGDYGFLTRWSSGGYTYIQNTPGYVPLGHANPDLQWQVNKKLEGAIDLGFFKDRLTMELAYYQNRCGNQLVSSPLPIQTGFSTIQQNLPALVQNTGIEGTVNGKIIENKNCEWSLNFDIGANRNKLISFPNLQQNAYYYGTYIIGQPLGIARLLHYTGVDPATGQYTFADKNHDGKINTNRADTANDLFNKDLSVKFDGGFGTDFRFRGFQINLFFRFRKQLLPSFFKYIGTPGTAYNFPIQVLNRWQKPGDHAEFARYTTQPQDSDNNFYSYSDASYSDGSYIRLQNISVSYDLPVRVIRKMGLSMFKIYVRGENLLLITKYKGLDPDAPFFGALPNSKIFTAGMQLNF